MSEIPTKLKVSGILFIILALLLAITAALPWYWMDLTSVSGTSTTTTKGYYMGNNALAYGGYITIILFIVAAISLLKNNKTRGAVTATIGEILLLINLIFMHVALPSGYDLDRQGNFFTMQVGAYLAWFVFVLAFILSIIVFTSKVDTSATKQMPNTNYSTNLYATQQKPSYSYTQESMMFCRHCGKQIKEGSTFCNSCGGQQ